MPLVQCVPNISEGRRPDVVAACRDAVTGIPGARLLDVHTDATHNRSVLTFAGEAPAVHDAAVALADRAVALIDLRGHAGVHPRIGALDVLPFVPLGGTSMAVCVDLAREVGARLARRHDLPVFLYEAAASVPARRRLADIRRGGFEGLAARLTDPAWVPDFGPTRPHPSAGALIVGARRPLIAFNVNLATRDVTVARAIAALIRERDGGLPGVRALGVPLADRGQVQVTMNLTDYRTAGLHDVFVRIRDEAARRGVAVSGSEIVGLVPAAALAAAASSAFTLEGFGAERIIECALGDPPGGLA